MYQPAANDAGKIDASHTFDAIGRAWSAGLLIHPTKDSVAMRDAGRDLGALYWRIFGLGSQDSLAKFMPIGGSGADRERSLEGALNHRLAAIRAKGHATRKATEALCIGDGMHFDSGPDWLDRIIWAKRRNQEPAHADAAILDRAIEGLAQIV